jgi:SAM-dependent methyltransferase
VPPTAADPALASRINARYDNSMFRDIADAYFGHSGFYNFGYWTPRTKHQREASEALTDRLVGFIPDRTGAILDVACGLGGTTRRLLRYYPASQVTGINISDKQLAECRRRAPGCRFLKMSATDLKFPDGSFQAILCVEAAFHFETRDTFLRAAYRVLAPGGYLVLSDILLRSRFIADRAPRMPPANFVPDPDRYRANLERVGFVDDRVTEARGPCWEGFRDHSVAFVWGLVAAGLEPPAALRSYAALMRSWDWAISHYLLVSARKPLAASPAGPERPRRGRPAAARRPARRTRLR